MYTELALDLKVSKEIIEKSFKALEKERCCTRSM
jgi:DNA-binding transcriptional regulator YhcF (GntR family)